MVVKWWSIDETMSISAVELRLARTATRSSKRNACAPLSVELAGLLTSCCCGARPSGGSVLALAEAVALEVERRHPVFLAVPGVPVTGLGLCSVAAAPSTFSMPRGRTDGFDDVARS